MKKQTLATLAFLVSLGSSTPTFAASADFSHHANFTTDTLSGLDWLDLATSINRSYEYVSNNFGNGGEFASWRYATSSEYTTLLANYTDTPPSIGTSYYRPYTPGHLTGLINMLGDTAAIGAYHYSGSTINEQFQISGTNIFSAGLIGSEAPTGSMQYAVIMNFTFGYNYYASMQPANFSPQHKAYHSASFLVRDTVLVTPIPAALFMFAPALLGFFGLRRKSKT